MQRFLKLLALTAALFIIFPVAGAISGTSATQPANPQAAGLYLLVVCFAFSAVISYPVVRSKWHGWPLVMAVAGIIYGVMTFLSQIETVVFLKA